MSREVSDLLRFISMVAVLFIHATGKAEQNFLKEHHYFSLDFLAVVVNQLARFSVPVFVFLSGYGLGLKYHRGFANFKEVLLFYQERFVKIALPFLFITITILSFKDPGFRFGFTFDALEFNFHLLLENLYYRNADYHLYFFTIILQCYLVLPLLASYPKSWLLFVFYIPLFLLTYPGFALLAKLGVSYPAWPAAALIYWVFYFYGGLLTARHLKPILAFIQRFSLSQLWLAVGLLLVILVIEYSYRSYTAPAADHYNHFHRLSVQLYSVTVLAVVFRSSTIIQTWLNQSKLRAQWIATGAALSFFIYIYHTWLLRLLEYYLFWLPALLLGVVLLGVMYLLAQLVDYLLPAKLKLVRILLGLPTKNH